MWYDLTIIKNLKYHFFYNDTQLLTIQKKKDYFDKFLFLILKQCLRQFTVTLSHQNKKIIMEGAKTSFGG